MRNVMFKRIISVSLACFLVVSISTHNALLQIFASETGDGDSGSAPYADPIDLDSNLVSPDVNLVDPDVSSTDPDASLVDPDSYPVNPDVSPVDPNGDPGGPNADPTKNVKEANIVFTFAEGTQYIDPAQYVQDQKDAILLNGVFAVDENGETLTSFRIQDYGDFNIDNPGSGKAFTITYAATHTVTQKVFTATRDVYVIMGIVAAASTTENIVPDWKRLNQAINSYSADTITIHEKDSGVKEDLSLGTMVLQDEQDFIVSDGTVIGVARNVKIKSAASNKAAEIILYANSTPGIRHFNVTGANVTFEFDNVVIDGRNTPSGSSVGGGISSTTTSSLTLENVVIQNCTTAVNGGGIYTAGTLNINGGKIIDNNAIYGGGIYAVGDVTVDGGAISGNRVASTGYGYYGYGGGIYARGNVKLIKGVINGNKAHSTTIFMSDSSGDGGGIYAIGDVIVEGGEISGNIAFLNGGGIWAKGNVTINDDTAVIGGDSKEKGNRSDCGGGIFCQGTVTLSAGKINSNFAGHYGGGIYLYRGMIKVEGGEIKYNRADPPFFGGGIYVTGSTVEISGDAVIEGNEATQGGGIYANYYYTYPSIYSGSAVIISDNAKIINNTAIHEVQSYGSGGGIYIAQNCTLTVSGNAQINNNNAQDYGGGIYNNLGMLTVNGGEISGNTSRFCGGIYENGGTITVNGGTINGNSAFTYDGGGIYGNNGTITVKGGIISGNTSTGRGGGIYGINGSTITVEGGTISGNKASSYGGGICSTNNTANAVTITGGTIENNWTTEFYSYGGGIYTSNSASKITISPAEGNEVIIRGNGKDAGGTVKTYVGGGICAAGVLEINGGKISNNVAANKGGGIYSDGTLTINAGEIIDNKVTAITTSSNGQGGGIYMADLNYLTVGADVTFSGNTAKAARWIELPDPNGVDISADIATHKLRISTDSRSAPPAGNNPFTYLYNNYDVSYTKGATESPLTATTYTVQFEPNGGTPVSPLTNVAAGSTITRPSPNPTRERYEFMYWYKDPALTQRWNFNTDTVTDNITLYARWEWTGEIIPGQ